MPIPQLLYHNPLAIPYRSNSTGIVAIRFPVPIRVTSIRICPEGVQSISGIGSTYPATWRGSVFVNLSGGSVVNALARSEIEVRGGDWEEDFEIGMPEGVNTRLIVLETPAEGLTLSIYGYHPSLEFAPVPHALAPTYANEDYSWLHTWSHGISGLYDLITPHTPRDLLERAMDCLDVLADTPDNTILADLLSHPVASSTLTTMLDNPSRLLQRILGDPVYSLHPAIQTEVQKLDAARHRTAWAVVESGITPLLRLAEDPRNEEDLLLVMDGFDRSNLSRLVDLANLHASHPSPTAQRSLELILDILSNLPDDHTAQGYLAKALPRLHAIASLRGYHRALPLDHTHLYTVVRELVGISTDVIEGRSAYDASRRLAEPYLQQIYTHRPLVTAFFPPSFKFNTARDPLSTSSSLPPLPTPPTFEQRQIDSFAKSLQSGLLPPTARQYSLTPQQILSVVAPRLLNTLQTAPIPLLGIQSTLTDATPESQASAWGGKVYTDHEFRRGRVEEMRGSVGLGIRIAGRRGEGAGGSPGNDGGGLGFGIGAFRGASRHVDQYRA